MYRIHFDARIGRFIIQVLVYGLFWKTVFHVSSQEEKIAKFQFEKHSFEKLTEASEHCTIIGLDKLYTNKSANYYREHMRKKRNELRNSHHTEE